jgi:hypothetical protein
MSIPLHLQRRFEQRWAARFVSPVASAAPQSPGLQAAFQQLPRPEKAKAKEKPAGLSQRLSLHQTFPRTLPSTTSDFLRSETRYGRGIESRQRNRQRCWACKILD